MTEPLRVLVFMHCSGLVRAERSVLELGQELRVDHDVSVTVVLPYEGPMRGRLEEEGAKVVIIDLGWWCDFDQHRLWQSAARLYGAKTVQKGQEDAIRAVEAVLDDAAGTDARVRRAGEFARIRNKRERYGAVVYDQLRSLAGRPNPTPSAWSGFFLDLLTHADTAWQMASGEAARLAAALTDATGQRDAARAENHRLNGEIDQLFAQRQRAAAAQAELAIQHGLVETERDEIRREFDRLARQSSDAARTFEAHIAATEAHIAATEATLGWRNLQRIRAIRDRLLPFGTRRRRGYSWVGRIMGPR